MKTDGRAELRAMEEFAAYILERDRHVCRVCLILNLPQRRAAPATACVRMFPYGVVNARFESLNAVGVCLGCALELAENDFLRRGVFRSLLGDLEFAMLAVRAESPRRARMDFQLEARRWKKERARFLWLRRQEEVWAAPREEMQILRAMESARRTRSGRGGRRSFAPPARVKRASTGAGGTT